MKSAPVLTPVISTTNLTKRFDAVLAVNGVNLTVYKGEVYGLLGPNGAGKTTVIGMLLGLVYPTSGTAIICTYDVFSQRRQALQQVGAMIETPAFYSYLSGWDNLRVLGNLSRPLSQQRLDQVVELIGMGSHIHKRFRTYSLGMKQRLAIGLTLLHNPQIIILDEPTNGLDPHGMVEIRGLIKELAVQGHTIVLCSHLLHEVEQVCSRVAILRNGELITQGDVRTVVGQSDLERTFLELTRA